MANEEHVKRLKQGVAEWNAWRGEWRKEARLYDDIDLTGADLPCAKLAGASLFLAHLSSADLRGADLSGANLNRSDLSGAKLNSSELTGASLRDVLLCHGDLRDANLIGSNLTGSNLTGANLIGSDLTSADLTGANLTGANLADANLIRTNLTHANLADANLTDATLSSTIFGDVDLTSVIGLETCLHLGPSVIDHQMLRRSQSLPLRFLRGVGLPDALIEYLPSLLNQAIQYYSCFISYSSKDQDFADRLHADLQNKGVRCWFAPHDLPIGGKILDEIDAAIRLRDKVLLILSEHSIKSGWVEDEVSKGFAEERKREDIVLFPVRLDDAVMDTNEAWAVKLRDQRNIGDFRRWKDHDGYKSSFERVLRDLKQRAGSEK